MVKSTLIILALIFTVGCGEKKVEPIPTAEVANSSSIVKEEVNHVAVTSSFVPAHIANSTIEVVPH